MTMPENDIPMYAEALLPSYDPLLRALYEHHPERQPKGQTLPQRVAQESNDRSEQPRKKSEARPRAPRPIVSNADASNVQLQITSPFTRRIAPGHIVLLIMDVFNVHGREFLFSRQRECLYARYAAFYLIRKHCTWASYPRIGKQLGGKDHTTVIHGIRRARYLLDPQDPRYSPEFAEKICSLEERVQRLKENRISSIDEVASNTEQAG